MWWSPHLPSLESETCCHLRISDYKRFCASQRDPLIHGEATLTNTQQYPCDLGRVQGYGLGTQAWDQESQDPGEIGEDKGCKE